MEQLSRIDHMKHGVIMGSAVGVCLGLAFGTYHIFRYGPGPRGYISTLGRYMASSAGSFALFMGIGSAIHSDERPKNIMLKRHLEQHQKFCQRGFANLPVEVLERNRWDRKIVGM
ncbi:reactive mitochondrial oxygen species modulator 1-domain-containing protein [Glomus cerebriforme]|uniref:Reactive mitochondrial oxygen species modulator 1-domain-containing protein n=1 Tax=Glomus cerebriforme TaxID=658196 RepID=A0A397TA49_9GLOM|nr:reactive mitochondrial oxygen species modulator 1-domain-containing protein [Glomus cerebriforme]